MNISPLILLHFFRFSDSLNTAKNQLEIAIVKWTEYENQHSDAIDWLNNTEALVSTCLVSLASLDYTVYPFLGSIL